ncbi:MAG: glutathione S-transferase family protein [Hyphomonadaceae bacterium]
MPKADVTAFILHQYDISPFSEKVRVAFGVKNLAWFACEQPNMMPKQELAALTGGYRRIPILQIGADLYFDSLFIIEELERRHPQPSLFAGSGKGVGLGLTHWSDEPFFRPLVGLLFGGDWDSSPEFQEDRAQLMGRPFNSAAMAAARPQLEAQWRAQLELLEAQLADGRAFLMGATPDVVDAAFYCQIAFARWGKGQTAAILHDYPGIERWAARVAAIGHGARTSISPQDTIDVARAASPAPIHYEIRPHANDPAIGDRVRVKYFDANTPALEGVLMAAAARHFSVLRESAEAGPLMLHIPRNMGALQKA